MRIQARHCDSRGIKAKVPAQPGSRDFDHLPQFVEARGGEYFFIPSMTALRMMAMGIVDPT